MEVAGAEVWNRNMAESSSWIEETSGAAQVGDHPRLTGALLAAGGLAGLYYWRCSAQRAALERATALQRNIRIVKQRDPHLLAHLLRHLFSSHVSHAFQACFRLRPLGGAAQLRLLDSGIALVSPGRRAG